MSNLQNLIQLVIEAKQDSKDFALFYLPSADKPWRAEIGNPSSYVMLGEAQAECSEEGYTAEEAVEKLLGTVKTWEPSAPKRREFKGWLKHADDLPATAEIGDVYYIGDEHSDKYPARYYYDPDASSPLVSPKPGWVSFITADDIIYSADVPKFASMPRKEPE